MIEARQRVDQFDAGISSEGVIVYRVQTPDPLGHAQNATARVILLTPTALAVGQSFTSDNHVTVQLTAVLPGGFSVAIHTQAIVPDVMEVSREIATNRVHAVGLVPKFTGQSLPLAWVSSQSPTAGQLVATGSTVTMHLHPGPLPP